MRFAVAFALLVLASCGSPNDPGVGGVTKSEAEALNDAAEMLDIEPPAEAANTQGTAEQK